jgi:hypothetical protein
MAVYLSFFMTFGILAVLDRFGLRIVRSLYAVAFIAVTLFAGLRFETGQDWQAYEGFFNGMDLSINPFDLYYSPGSIPPQFEIGYYLLNYGIKFIGGTYSSIFLLAATFCGFAIYRLTDSFKINKFYVLAVYFSYSFMILNFAQVRQALAISFFILGCDSYVRHRKILPAFAWMAIGPLFQFTSLMYILGLPVAIWWPKRRTVIWAFLAIGVLILILGQLVDFYSLLALVASNASAEDKIAIYKDTQTDQSSGLRIQAAYLLLLVWYMIRNMAMLPPRQKFIVRYGVVSLLFSILMVLAFPGSYVMYSRAYVVGGIFQGLALAIVFAKNKNWKHTLLFAATLLVAFATYARLISLYDDEYTPYQSVILAN